MPAIRSLGGLRGRGNGRAKNAAVGRPSPVPLSTYVVDCAVYVDGKRLPGRWTHSEAIREVQKRGDGFVWIGMHEPDSHQIQTVVETFGLHELAVEDALEAHQRPKLERYDDTLFMVVKTVRYASTSRRPPRTRSSKPASSWCSSAATSSSPSGTETPPAWPRCARNSTTSRSV
jgi:magnesium transporter